MIQVLRFFKILYLIFPACLVSVPAAGADYLTASGCSVSNVGYLTELAKEYERRTGTKVFVRGGGTVLGIEDLKSRKVDFAASCRDKDGNDPRDIRFVQVAWDALVFVVHKSNPVTDISLDDVRAVYAGQITNWKQLKGRNEPIKVFISRAKKGLSGVESSTREMVLRGRNPVESGRTVFLASTAIVEQVIEDSPEGFATTGFSSARKRDIKMLKVNGVSPSHRNIVNNKYPLKRPLFILLPPDPRPEARRFLEYALSKEGQRFISSLGVVSLLDVKETPRHVK